MSEQLKVQHSVRDSNDFYDEVKPALPRSHYLPPFLSSDYLQAEPFTVFLAENDNASEVDDPFPNLLTTPPT